MSTPFPGMDPFLEYRQRWQSFHGWFIHQLAQLHLEQAKQMGCWIDVEKDVYVHDPDGRASRVGDPDFMVRPSHALEGSRSADGGQHTSLAIPTLTREFDLDYREGRTHRQYYLIVREMNPPARVLAVVELLSPSNKRGRDAKQYRRKRQMLIDSESNFLEIDFLRGGRNASREMFPDLPPTPYFLFVARKANLHRRFEAYSLRLQDVLPTVALPLSPAKPDLFLDLQATFRGAFDLAVRPGAIDYQHDSVPPPALSPDDATWIRELTTA